MKLLEKISSVPHGELSCSKLLAIFSHVLGPSRALRSLLLDPCSLSGPLLLRDRLWVLSREPWVHWGKAGRCVRKRSPGLEVTPKSALFPFCIFSLLHSHITLQNGCYCPHFRRRELNLQRSWLTYNFLCDTAGIWTLWFQSPFPCCWAPSVVCAPLIFFRASPQMLIFLNGIILWLLLIIMNMLSLISFHDTDYSA